MHIAELSGKNICILGFGKEGRAMAEAIETHAKGAEITVADQNEKTDIPDGYWKQLGTGWLLNLQKFDVLIKSPGIPPKPEFDAVQAKMTSPTQIFLDSVQNSDAITIGITGSKGKSTTSALLAAILKDDERDVHLVGNIGEPVIRHISDAKPGAIFVMEMSSYQLMDLTVSPDIAVITSFFPEHLDYHGSLQAYLDAKKNITKWQKENGVVFYNADFPEAKEIAELSKGKRFAFSVKDCPLKAQDITLKGEHNRGNIAGAYAVAMHMKAEKSSAIETIRSFRCLPHRLETVALTGSVEWVNDSISTAPETAVAALNALGDRVKTIIVGGQDRGYDFSILGERIASSAVQNAILLPDSGYLIGKEIERAGAHVLLAPAKDMPEAVAKARDLTQEGIVLLSPASPSYGHFKNFEDRGDQFRVLAKVTE